MNKNSYSDDFSVLEGPAEQVAPRLLGCLLVRKFQGQTLIGKIVETEAYDQTDAASHSYRGETERTRVMFGEAGHLYVYFTYGMHYCCNVVVSPEGHGSAVLIRAVEPVEGIEVMEQLRAGRMGVQLTNGPAKVCYAFAIDKALNGHNLKEEPLQLLVGSPVPKSKIVQTVRVGINQAKDVPWRFYIKDNPYVSKAPKP